uniref:Uncharacterized protein n=1 Tax=Nelumbo nucifera TaxID=4432 RepID=A0A822Z4C1_NELNU|nr:TPA_asm: hypothetical protein HUJ06_013716 [Nelumbo nucifera]
MDISEAAKELIHTRDIFHGIRVHQHQVRPRTSQLEVWNAWIPHKWSL